MWPVGLGNTRILIDYAQKFSPSLELSEKYLTQGQNHGLDPSMKRAH